MNVIYYRLPFIKQFHVISNVHQNYMSHVMRLPIYFLYGLLFDTTNRIRIVKCGLLGNQCPQPLLWWWYIPVNLTFPSIFLWLVWGISRTNLLYIFHLYFVIVLPKDAFVIYDTIQPVQAVQQEMQYFFKFLWLNDLTAYTCQFASKTILLSLNKVQCWFLHYVK